MPYKILLVEDNLPMMENTTEILELSDYKVLSACNGKNGENKPGGTPMANTVHLLVTAQHAALEAGKKIMEISPN